jgi:hypothetical protein
MTEKSQNKYKPIYLVPEHDAKGSNKHLLMYEHKEMWTTPREYKYYNSIKMGGSENAK